MLVAHLDSLDGIAFLPRLLVKSPIIFNPGVGRVSEGETGEYLIV